MNKKELTEAIKIIYDTLNEGKDSTEEIKNLKDELEKRDFLLKLMIRIFAPIVKSSQFSFDMKKTTPFEMVKYIKSVINNNVMDNQSIDDKFIDEMVILLKQKNY